MFLGDELTAILEAIKDDKQYAGHGSGEMQIGVDVLPSFPIDNTDRNRTSPFAFTGNKFEFRMPGSKLSIAGPNTVLNTIVAEALDEFYEVLKDADDFNATLHDLIKKTINENWNIIFNGDGYSSEWPLIAEKRGLLNLKSTPEAIPHFADPKNVEVFTKHGVYSEAEIHSRIEILLEEYVKILNIEALTMIDMAKKDILPAISTYVKELGKTAKLAKECGAEAKFEVEVVKKLSALESEIYEKLTSLETITANAAGITDIQDKANFYHDEVFTAMGELRAPADEAEKLCGEKYWPYPTYGKMLFYV